MGLFDKIKNLVTEGAEVQILEPTGAVALDGDLSYRVLVRAKRDVQLSGLGVRIDRRETDFGESGIDRHKRDRLAESIVSLDVSLAAGEQRELTGQMRLRSVGHVLNSSVGRGLESLTRGMPFMSGGSQVRYVLTAVVDIVGSANPADTSIEVDIS